MMSQLYNICNVKHSFKHHMGVIYFWDKADLSYNGLKVKLVRQILKAAIEVMHILHLYQIIR